MFLECALYSLINPIEEFILMPTESCMKQIMFRRRIDQKYSAYFRQFKDIYLCKNLVLHSFSFINTILQRKDIH